MRKSQIARVVHDGVSIDVKTSFQKLCYMRNSQIYMKIIDYALMKPDLNPKSSTKYTIS